ncbi:MAG: adenylate/guanylate cyclase domain-containing protein [Spirochaetes bacterium]|jgi:class 3 adenylate cyclase|nr:adenylate/guanylate cyclase domain-containing protein [Spirochaetota bacterium]
MSTIMNIMMLMMYMIPKKIRDRMKPPMMPRARYKAGKDHPAIKMNLTNLMICAKNCGTCPSYSGVIGEALYCASGASKKAIEENGCNCVSCPLYDKCSAYNTAYFCIHGSCSSGSDKTRLSEITDLTRSYLLRFTLQDNEPNDTTQEDAEIEEILNNEETINIALNFTGEKKVDTKSDTPILQASLSAGIPHTHICGGRARCSTCRVIVTEGAENCRPRNKRESRLAKTKGFSPEVRLACQTTAVGDLALRRLVLDDNDISEAINQGRRVLNEAGRECYATIMFSDIRSFTSFSEKALPYDVIHILNRYFEEIGSVIDSNGGYIDKYMGDGIMAIFGLDHDNRDHHEMLAAKSAVEMIIAVNDFNTYLKNHFAHTFKIGIGLHTGNVIIGNLGFSRKKEYTALGDTVNTASRIESLNKRTGTSILVSDTTYKKIKNDFLWKKTFKTKVKGKTEPITVHELIDLK